MNILDPKFKYVNAASTDIRKTFARARREQMKAKEAAEARKHVVTPLKRKEVR